MSVKFNSIQQYFNKHVIVQFNVYGIKAGLLSHISPEKITITQDKAKTVLIPVKQIQKIQLIDGQPSKRQHPEITAEKHHGKKNQNKIEFADYFANQKISEEEVDRLNQAPRKGYDQFEMNEKLSGEKSKFDFNTYTVKV